MAVPPVPEVLVVVTSYLCADIPPRYTCTMKRAFVGGLLALLVPVTSILGQDTLAVSARASSDVRLGTRVGVYGALALNMSSSSIAAWRIQTVPNPLFERWINRSLRMTEGSTTATLLGGMTVVTPLSAHLHFTGRVGLNWLTASTSATQPLLGDSVLTHRFDASSLYLEMTPGLEYHDLIPEVPVYVLGGLELGIPLSLSQEQLTDLDIGAAYVGNQDITPAPGNVPSSSVRLALALGVGYTMELGKDVWLQPEVSYRLPVSNVSSNNDYNPWSIGQLRFGVSLSFTVARPSSPIELPTDDRRLGVNIARVTTMSGDGQMVDVSSINVEDYTYTEMFPLVPFVFYPQGAAAPTAALQQTGSSVEGSFEPTSLPLDAIEVNRNLLNIVGSRMVDLQHATLTITGTTDATTEVRIPELGNRRALWAKDYLVTTFGITPSRIAVRAIARPTKPSSESDPEGAEENRRIELSSNVPDLLAPVVITADQQRIATPGMLQFHPDVANADRQTDSVVSWTLSISQAGRPLRDVSGTTLPSKIDWIIKPNDLGTTQVPVDYELSVRSQSGQEAVALGSVPVDYASSVRKRTENLPDKTIDKYSLILFDFNTATLSEDNLRVLERMVLPSIAANSKVQVIGYTDRIGSDVHNRTLSRERAEAVSAFLRQKAPSASYTTTGVGEDTEIHPNSSPVGRQLSRTVQVLVETPRR